MEDKAKLRKKLIETRKSLSEELVKAKSELIVQKVLNTPEYIEADNILLYADCNNEVMTRGIFDDAILHKKKVFFPKSDALTNMMEFYQTVSVRQLDYGYKGILEPKESVESLYRFRGDEDTLMIVPGVGFDMSGYRVGYGKGYYDRYLANKRQISTMALAYACQLVDELEHEEHDIKMDKIVTEEIIYSFLRI